MTCELINFKKRALKLRKSLFKIKFKVKDYVVNLIINFSNVLNALNALALISMQEFYLSSSAIIQKMMKILVH